MSTIRKRQLKNGSVSYQALIRRGTVSETRTFPTKAKAQAWAREVEGKIDRRQYYDVSDFKKLTCAELFAQYAQEVAPSLKGERWVKVRIAMLIRTAKWMPVPVVDVRAEDLKAWRDARLKEVSAASVDRELNVVSAVFSWTIREQDIRITNPVAGVARPKGADKARDRLYELSEIKRILRAMGYSRKEDPVTGTAQTPFIFLLCLRTAMRLSEACSINRDMVHSRAVNLPDTKTGRPRAVPLSRKAERLLSLAMGDRYALTNSSPDVIGLYFRRARDAAGVSGVTFHDTRHWAVVSLSRKLNPLELARVTGHSSSAMLQRYYSEKAETLAAKLD